MKSATAERCISVGRDSTVAELEDISKDMDTDVIDELRKAQQEYGEPDEKDLEFRDGLVVQHHTDVGFTRHRPAAENS